jgi:hypothetical protein
MPTLLTTPPADLPVDYDLLVNAERVHAVAGYDFPSIFDYYFKHQWVFKGPGYLLMGGHDPQDPDAWLVWWAEAVSTHPKYHKIDTLAAVRLFLRLMPYRKPRVAWARPLNGRTAVKYYSTERLLRLTKLTPRTHAT